MDSWTAEQGEPECGQAHSNSYLHSHERFKVQAKNREVHKKQLIAVLASA